MITSKQGIKSIQRGVITFDGSALTATATIAATSMPKSTIDFLGNTSGGAERPCDDVCTLELTNTTTVTAARSIVSPYVMDATYQVTEYY